MMASLKILATPLGNVRDISVRAMDELKKADVIFAEDTRHSLNLIVALGIELKPSCRLVSLAESPRLFAFFMKLVMSS